MDVIVLHCLDIIWVNSYVLYKETSYLHHAVNNDDIDSHKKFFVEFTNSLICRAYNENKEHSVTRQETPVGEVEHIIHLYCTRQHRFSRTDPSLSWFDHVRFQPGDHRLIPYTQQKCKYCQYLATIATVNKEPHPEVKRSRQECRICKVSLSNNHKDLFHAR